MIEFREDPYYILQVRKVNKGNKVDHISITPSKTLLCKQRKHQHVNKIYSLLHRTAKNMEEIHLVYGTISSI